MSTLYGITSTNVRPHNRSLGEVAYFIAVVIGAAVLCLVQVLALTVHILHRNIRKLLLAVIVMITVFIISGFWFP